MTIRRRALVLVFLAACAETRGSKWMAEPLPSDDPPATQVSTGLPSGRRSERAAPHASDDGATEPAAMRVAPSGRPLGVFRNTYYDFPSEGDYGGPSVAVMSAACTPIAEVPRAFFEALCVQGSGNLRRGATVSFAKRDCGCAEVCPRTGQKICFEALDPGRFPFGRGARGTPITPLRTVAVDSDVVPLGTALYVAEFDGLVVDEGSPPHDGCFLAEDRGSRVKGNQLDVFTGDERTRERINALVPSNAGVHVFADVDRCRHLAKDG